MTSQDLARAITRICDGLSSRIDAITALDAALGDGDLGVTVRRAVEALRLCVETLPADLGDALSICAHAITRTSGSTFGTLTALGLTSAARCVKGRNELPWAELPAILDVALENMLRSSGAQLGDKTMLDSVHAVAGALRSASPEPEYLLEAAAGAARQSLSTFRARPCRQGRARIFGARSEGRDDPGMVVIAAVVESLAREQSHREPGPDVA